MTESATSPADPSAARAPQPGAANAPASGREILSRSVRAHFADPLYRNGTFLMLNGASGALLGFAFWWIAARLFAPAALGFGAGVVSAMTLVALVSKFGFDAALIRYVPLMGAGGRARLLARACLVSGGGAFVLGLASAAVASRTLESLAPLQAPGPTVAFALGAAALALAWVLDAYFVAEREARMSFYRNTVYNGARVVAPLLLAPLAPRFGIPLAWAIAVALSLSLGLVVPRLLKRHAAVPERAAPAGFRRFAGVNAVVAIGEFLAILLLPVVVLEVAGAEANARFYVAWTLASLAFLFSKAIAQSAFAELASGAAARTVVAKATRHHALVLAPVLAGMLVTGPVVLGLFGPAYVDAYPVLVVLVPSAVGVAVTNVYVTLLRQEEALVELAILPATVAVAAVVVSAILLGTHGLLGLAVGWLVVTTLGGAWSARGLAKRLDPARAPRGVGSS